MQAAMMDPMEVDANEDNQADDNDTMDADDDDIDPIDGGPKLQVMQQQQQQQQSVVKIMSPLPQSSSATPTLVPFSMSNNLNSTVNPNNSNNSTLPKEEEARLAIDMLRNEDVASRVAAAHRLDSVAMVLGEERTRNELIPFVTDGIDDEDEVLLALASSLGRMVDHVGGPAHAHVLLRPLELLLTVEENSVRDVASASTMFIAAILPTDSFVTHYASTMLARLALKEWFTARMSAASLIAAAYPKISNAPDVQEQHLQYFAQLCQDDTPMVRRVAAQYLGVMLKNVVQVNGRDVLRENGPVATILIPLFEQFASNEQPDSVRLQTTENCVAFGQVMSNIVKQQQHQQDGLSASASVLQDCELALLKRILPLVVATIDDRSWRVRWTAAAKFANVISAYDELPDVMDALVPAYEKLLQDPEAEVRTAATFNLARVAQCKALVPMPLSPQNRPTSASAAQSQQLDGGGGDGDAFLSGPRVSVAERLVKRVTSLTEDDSEHVRAALAMVATELAPILGKDATITHLVPPVLLLLRDAASEVRLNLISSLSALNEVIGVDLLSQSLLPAILDLAQDGKWRIRLAIIQHIPLLAKQLGKDFFTEKLASMCVGWLGDDIASIRIAAAGNLKQLTGVFGTEWATNFLIPSIMEIRGHESYLRRLTALQAFSLMATEMDPDTARLHVLPLVLEMTTDPVANIRFNVAKELQNMIPSCGPGAYESQALPVLNMLLDDDDRDVRYFAEQSLHALSRYIKASKGS